MFPLPRKGKDGFQNEERLGSNIPPEFKARATRPRARRRDAAGLRAVNQLPK